MQQQTDCVAGICPFDFLLGAVALTVRHAGKYHSCWGNAGHVLRVMASAGYRVTTRDSQLISRLLQSLDHMVIKMGGSTCPDDETTSGSAPHDHFGR
jgi:hypothetical protein